MLDVKHKPTKESRVPRANQKAAQPPATRAAVEHIAFQLVTPPSTPTKEEDNANAAANAAVSGRSSYGIIIEDDLPVGEGQVHRTEFMDHLAPLIESTAEQILSPAGRAARDCPYLAFWISYYRQQSAAHIEHAIALYVRPERTDQEGIEQAILDHVRQAVQVWVDRREVQVPGSIDWRVDDDHVPDKPSDGAVAQRMGADGRGAPTAPGSAAAIRGQLSVGRPLEPSVRTRMERGFGTSFEHVRLHDDAKAASLARTYQARAFTVGQDVAFSAGQYRPGTLTGDLLLAHELAHTLQQRSAAVEGPAAEGLETDATLSAIGAVLPDTRLDPRPSLRGGLGLRRCGTGEEPAPPGISEKEYKETIVELKALYAHRAELPSGSAELAGVDRRIRELTEVVWGWGVQLSDRQLKRAVESGEDLRGKVGQPFSLDPEDTMANKTSATQTQAPAPAPKDVDTIDLTGVKFDAPTSDSRVLLIWNKNKKDLYVLPARGLVYTAQAPAVQPGQPAPTGPVFGVPVAGHAGAYLVKTDQGVGMMVDAGGKTSGAPEVLMPTSLAYLQARMNIGEIDGALLSHTHADHLANVPMLVQQEHLTGSIYVWPGWESATKGPMADVWRALEDPGFTQFGKGPGWRPVLVAARQIPGPAGATGVTQGTLQIGSVQMDFVTSTEKLQKYVRALQAGQKGGQFADSASKLVRITPIGGKFNVLIVGDLRGADIKELNTQMGDAAFKDFVKDTRVFGGIQHHLGAVNSKADVEGIRILLKAIGPTEEPLTAVVQTGDAKNQDLIEALQLAGVRVVTLGEIDPSKLGKVTFTAKGDLRSDRASVFEADPTIRASQQRIFSLTRAVEALEKYPDELMGIGKTTAEIAEGLKTEVNRLRTAVEARQDLATSKLHTTTAVADIDNQLKNNEQELKRVAGMEANLGEQIEVLSRFRTRADEIRAEREKSRQRGESSRRLRQLIAEVEPKLAEQILAEELSATGLSKRSQRRAKRVARERIRKQGRLNQLAEPGAPRFVGVRSGPGVVAVALIALEVFELAEPFISQYVQEKDEAKFKDFYTFLQVAGWWQDHGAAVPVIGLRGGTEVTDAKDLLSGVKKRIWKDLPKERQVPEGELAADIKSAVPLDKLCVPELSGWKNAPFVWDSFRNWVSSNVKNYDDYASEFEDLENPAIRSVRKPGMYFKDLLWEVRTGRIEGDHVSEGWQFSPDLTLIMRATATRVIAGTEAQIEQEKARQSDSGRPGYHAIGTSTSDDSPQIDRPLSAVTGIGHFKSGATRKVHGSYRFTEANPSPLWSRSDDPEFLVYGSQAAPREGYVLVGPGDYNTYIRMRSVKVLTYDPEQSIKLPRDRTKPYESIPSAPDRTPREQYGEDAVARGDAEFVGNGGSIYRGEARFPFWTPNESALLWMKKDGLNIEPFSPPKPQPK